MATRDVLVGMGIGAFVLFIADPRAGRRRRALATDQFMRASRKTRDALDETARDMANRTSGIVAAARTRWTDERVDDRRLLERVRAKLGRACSHPRAIEVDVANGAVTLRGPILAQEVDNVLTTVRGVRGVLSVANALEPHESADGVAALQGQGSIADPEIDGLTVAGLAATAVCMAAYARSLESTWPPNPRVVRTGQGSTTLTKEEFRWRWIERFFDLTQRARDAFESELRRRSVGLEPSHRPVRANDFP